MNSSFPKVIRVSLTRIRSFFRINASGKPRPPAVDHGSIADTRSMAAQKWVSETAVQSLVRPRKIPTFAHRKPGLQFPMKLRAIIHVAEEGGYWAEVPALPGCVTQADTREELETNLQEAVEGWLSAGEAEMNSTPDEIFELAV